MLPSRIQPLHPSSASPTSISTTHDPANTNDNVDIEGSEDLLSSFLPHLFPDEAPPCLGNPGQTLLYTSPLFGVLRLAVPDYDSTKTNKSHNGKNGEGNGSDKEASRRLMAHYLWGGALVIAERIEEAVRAEMEARKELKATGMRAQDIGKWTVRGEKVLEVGAGTALPSLIAARAGAHSVYITDHPASAALAGPVQSCIAQNFSSQTINGDGIRPRISVHPHEWGVFFKNDGPQSIGGTGMLEFEAEHKGTFTRIICADCLWMKDQHGALVRSLLWFLKPSSHSERNGEDGGIAWVVAGFHSGREIVASFFDTAVSMGMVVKDIYERDVNATVEMGEVRREWKPVREGEGPENRARWCVVAVLKKRGC